MMFSLWETISPMFTICELNAKRLFICATHGGLYYALLTYLHSIWLQKDL